MRFLYIKVLQILNQMVDLMLRIVGHIPRVSHVTSIFTQLWGTMQLMSPTQILGGRVPSTPRDLRPWIQRQNSRYFRCPVWKTKRL